MVLAETLPGRREDHGNSSSETPDWRALAASYKAEINSPSISLRRSRRSKGTLKSPEPSRSLTPYLLGAVRGKAHDEALEEGFKQERMFLTNNLDLSGAAQSNGAGGNAYSLLISSSISRLDDETKDFRNF